MAFPSWGNTQPLRGAGSIGAKLIKTINLTPNKYQELIHTLGQNLLPAPTLSTFHPYQTMRGLYVLLEEIVQFKKAVISTPQSLS